MLKVFLLDDEKLIIDELKQIINWGKYGFQVIGWETNSRKAFVQIAKLKPHLVISDINMPNVNGLSLFERVREINPLINFCFLSAYDYFEYVQEALKLGAINYLKKPIDVDELILMLKRISDNFDEEFSEKLYEAAISRQYIEADPYFQSLFENNAFIKANQLYRIVTFSDFNSDYIDESKLSSKGFYLLYKEKRLHIYLVYECDLAYLSILNTKYNMAIGISEEFSDFFKVSNYFRFSRIAAYQSFITGKNEITIVSKNPKLEVLLSEINEASNIYELQMVISRLKERIVSYDIKCYDLQAVYRIVMFNFVKFGILPFDYKFEEISVINNYFDLDSFVKEMNSFFVENTNQTDDVSVIDSIKKEVENNISEHYSLSYFADNYHYNLSYLSQLFKKETGCSFTEYVTNVKMNVAKSLIINNGELSLSQISEQVGYKDYYHFSKMFKKINDESPSDYAKRNHMKI